MFAEIIMIYIFFLHWVADFVCQTRWMADNKSKRLTALLLHVAAYASVLTTGVFLLSRFSSETIFLFFLINFAAHLATDYFTSKVTSKAWAAGKTHKFFSVIGFDQFIHASTLVLTTRFLIGAI